jgi:hypothetical protein
MNYLIFGEGNKDLVELRLAKNAVKKYKFIDTFDIAISYFQEQGLTKACFMSENMFFHKQYHEFFVESNKDLVVLTSDFFTGKLISQGL